MCSVVVEIECLDHGKVRSVRVVTEKGRGYAAATQPSCQQLHTQGHPKNMHGRTITMIHERCASHRQSRHASISFWFARAAVTLAVLIGHGGFAPSPPARADSHFSCGGQTLSSAATDADDPVSGSELSGCDPAEEESGSAESLPAPVEQEPTQILQRTIFSNISIERQGTSAVVSFTTNQPVTAGVEYAPGRITVAEPVPGAPPVPHQPSGGLSLPAVRPPGDTQSGFTGLVSPSETSHTVPLNQLKSNSAYWLRIWAQDENGALAQSQPVAFETLKRRLTITFEEAHIFDTGDFFGEGEPTWFFSAYWENPNPGSPSNYSISSCFPYTADPPDSDGYARAACLSGDTGQASNITDPDGGRVLPFYSLSNQPLSYVFAEENFGAGLPEHIRICGFAREDDSGFGFFDTLLHVIASFPSKFDPSGAPCSVQWDVLTPTAQHARLTANDSPDEGFRSDVIVRLQELYDDVVYSGYTDGGLAVSTFPVSSNVHLAHQVPPSKAATLRAAVDKDT